MSLRCKLIEIEKRTYELPKNGLTGETVDKATGDAPRPGDMFYAPWMLDGERGLAPKYFALSEPRRAPIIVVLPNGTHFCVDTMAHDKDRGDYGEGWDVAGTPPALTVNPSINIVGSWHGFLRNGELDPA
jgi:hypothetical protein